MSDVHLQTASLPVLASFRFGEASSLAVLTMTAVLAPPGSRAPTGSGRTCRGTTAVTFPLTTETGRKDAWT